VDDSLLTTLCSHSPWLAVTAPCSDGSWR